VEGDVARHKGFPCRDRGEMKAAGKGEIQEKNPPSWENYKDGRQDALRTAAQEYSFALQMGKWYHAKGGPGAPHCHQGGARCAGTIGKLRVLLPNNILNCTETVR